MRSYKIWWVKIFLTLGILNGLSWAQENPNKTIPGRTNGVGFQLGSLRSSVSFKSQYISYEGTSFYSLSGLWFKIKKFPAIFLAFSRNPEIEGSKRFYVYVPVMIDRKALFEFELAYLKGFNLKDLDSEATIELKNFESMRMLGSVTLFLKPNNFSWKHAFSFGERQIKSGGTWAVGSDLGLYSFNIGRNIPLVLNDSSVIFFRQLSMLFVDVFFGAYYNFIIKSWQKNGKTRTLGLGGSLMLGLSMQIGNVTLNNKNYSTSRLEMFGLVHGSFHMLYTTDRWVFRIYTFARKHNVSFDKLITIGNHWSNAAFQIIYLFGPIG